MKDIQKDPIQPGQIPAPQNNDNGAKIVVIVLAVVFGLPLLFVIVILTFITLNFDKFTEWLDKHIDKYETSAYLKEASVSASKIYDAATGRNVQVSRDDCYNVVALLNDVHGDDSGAAELLDSVCEDDEMLVAGKEDGRKQSVFFEKDNACLELVFKDNFSMYYSHSYKTSLYGGCDDVETKTVPLLEGDNEINKPLKEIIQES
jgi:hypothetical protein